MVGNSAPQERTVLFISKATPGDDEFALWLAPRLEAAGYEVFADILTLEPGTRGRKEITDTLQKRAAKMLLCGRTATLEREGVQEEIGIAEDLAKDLSDKKFIIPLRLEKYKKVFGIGELQYVNLSAAGRKDSPNCSMRWIGSAYLGAVRQSSTQIGNSTDAGAQFLFSTNRNG
ncbi:MAG: toll/interleukin-1 receptor domain-containing protein [Xanthobacteraceae bacterium]